MWLYLDLEWKIIYVGSASSSDFDQELDSVLVGPVVMGMNKFVFEVLLNQLLILTVIRIGALMHLSHFILLLYRQIPRVLINFRAMKFWCVLMKQEVLRALSWL